MSGKSFFFNVITVEQSFADPGFLRTSLFQYWSEAAVRDFSAFRIPYKHAKQKCHFVTSEIAKKEKESSLKKLYLDRT